MSKETYLRLHIIVKDKHYYDVGLRKGNLLLSKYILQGSEKIPRFLEDFIDVYGTKEIIVIDYGKLIDDKKYIDELLA